MCCHAFTPVEMVTCYSRGLQESVREYVREETSHLPMLASADINLVRAKKRCHFKLEKQPDSFISAYEGASVHPERKGA